MTDESQPPPDDAPPQETGLTPAAGAGTGEGGPPRLREAPPEPSGAGRPPRAPHLTGATERRPAITDEPAQERAIVQRAQRRRARRREVTRRQFVRSTFWGTLGLTVTASVGGFLAFFWPRGLQGFGGTIPVSADLVPEPGDPPARIFNGKFWLANLKEGEGPYGGFGIPGPGGLLALWWKCPHLGCTVPWRSDFTFEGVLGWFRCPCHGSTYTKAGVRVFGPAPRPMDTMAITLNDDGSLVVDTGAITKGGEDNPQRSVPYGFGPAAAHQGRGRDPSA